MPSVSISDAEWEVMNVIWERQPATAQEIIAALEGREDWAPATIKTMLHRLAKKGALAYEAQGNRYVYRAPGAARSLYSASGAIVLGSGVRRRMGGPGGHFLRDSKFTAKDIAQLRRLLDEQEKRS